MNQLIAIIIALLSIIAHSKQLSHNLNYNGPFNPYIREAPRRLLADSAALRNVSFYHGIASGDPTDTDILLWTRVTPPYQNEYREDLNNTFNSTQIMALKAQYETISVDYAISTSMDGINFECDDTTCGSLDTSYDIDHTVKIIVDNLSPNTWYYYQFRVGSSYSDMGRTRTIPSSDGNVMSFKFAFGSCKQYAHGFFNNLGDIADRNDLDILVWLGDYIYEFPNDPLVDGEPIGRIPFPNEFLYELDQYRGRYASHKLDTNVARAHQRLPWIMIWDDHEVVNDYWKTGGPDRWQDDTILPFAQRRTNGYQAFFEWNPIRTVDVDARGGLHKSFRFGNLFDLVMIDARSQRTQDVENITYGASLSADEHYCFGETQRSWILNELQESQDDGVQWRLLGSNDNFGQSPPPEVFEEREFFGTDNIEGYDAERQIILDYIINNGIDNVVSMAGGPHTGIAQKVFSTGIPIENDDGSYPIMTEFCVDAISAPKLFEDRDYVPFIDAYSNEWGWVSPYFRLQMDGYSIMTVTNDVIKVEFWINNNTKLNDTKSELDVEICVRDGIVDFDVGCVITNDPTSQPTPDDTDSIMMTASNKGAETDGDDEDNDLWMIIAIVFIILFAITLGILIWHCYGSKKEDGGLKKPTHNRVESGIELGDTPTGGKGKTFGSFPDAENQDLL